MDVMSTRANGYRPAAAAAPQPAAQEARPEMTELKGSNCPWTSGCQKLRATGGNEPITVSWILKNPKDTKVSTGAFRPASPESTAATPGQIKDVEKFAKANGLKIASVDPETRTVKLTGTAQQYQKALGVELSQYKDGSGTQFRSYEGNLKVPPALAKNVQAILGLDTHPVAHTNFVQAPRLGQSYTPPQVAQLYNFPKADGTGQTIGIIELGGGYNESDLQKYFQGLGIPEPKVSAVGVDGGSNAPEGSANGADGEVGLDIEVAGAVAPNANIKVYFAPNTDQGFVDAVGQAAKDGCNIESISWGAPESAWSDQAMDAFNAATKDAAAKGVSIFAASGDNGSADGQKDKQNHADFPAASPWVIGTGGTKLNSSNGQITRETSWNDGFLGGAGGGGVSNHFPKPDFQKDANVPAPTQDGGGRGVPDVAGDASPMTGYQVLVDGSSMSIGGTSAVAPLYAGLAADLGSDSGAQTGFLNPFFYRHPGDFNDITTGNNGGFKAGPGWDPVTGLGSPNGGKLLADLKAEKEAEKA